MKILLIRSDTWNDSCETNISGVYPPLGLAYIASVLKNAELEVALLDNQIWRLRGNALKDEIKKNSPQVVLLSAMTPSWPAVVSLSRLIKEISSDITVGVGGPHLSVYPTEALSHKSIDFGIYAEGEHSALEALKAIREGRALDDVKGCVFRKDDRVIVNAPRQQIEDLDSIPFPSIEALPYKKYFALSVQNPFFTMVTSRGCPYRCKFCFQGYLGGYRARSPENVVSEMELLVNKYGIKEIVVFDETFAVEGERALNICRLIRQKKLRFKWDLRTRIDLLNPQMLASLKSAGCRRLHLGIESGNQEILNKMDKGTSIAQIVEKVQLVKKYGFQARGYFMLGFPQESCEAIGKTIEFAKSLPLDWASFTITIGLPCTDIYNEALESGYFSVDYWREYAKGNRLDSKPYFLPVGCQEGDLFALKKKAYKDFYLRPKIAWNMIKNSGFSGIISDLRVVSKLLPSMHRPIASI